ncbi:murein hydrolase activator EnvC family protein [Limoniibacter endophyticus]|uniref:Membrane protein n=1 Tax=Limoniibacter endophyticus TaxID=1565040 RepID=A0A8J3GHB8_9HYPH|nr:murein hydrolase activator EnvC [Limoniibacter endophyticus]GHC73787.1 membrane protein [Limoniibacter endophyticus]
MKFGYKRILLAAGFCLTAGYASFPAHAEDEVPAPDTIRAYEERQAETRTQFEQVARDLASSHGKLEKLRGEIDGIKKDHASLTAAMIQAAKTEKKLSADVDEIGERLTGLADQEEAISLSLESRREVLAEVLGALQRMGLNPPPALLVTPDDALSSVRSAILLGAVVPEMRAETRILMTDLADLGKVRASIEEEKERLGKTIEEQVAEQQRLTMLIEEKNALQAQNQETLEAEQLRAAEMAERAVTLKELIAALDTQILDARSAKEKELRAEEERQKRRETLAALPVPEANRLSIDIPFSRQKGNIPLPVSGRLVTRFGQSDDLGQPSQGDTLATQSGAIVTSPANGDILYAGPFRSYGQLLILDAGDGYHIVLAGMDRVNVTPGQAVLAGEPIGAMANLQVASASSEFDSVAAGRLYVEFRKDGGTINPAPWWSSNVSGRTKNGS